MPAAIEATTAPALDRKARRGPPRIPERGSKSSARLALHFGEGLVLLGAVVVLLFELFSHPVAGLADNGDFLRVQEVFGLVPVDGPQYFSFVPKAYWVERDARVPGLGHATSSLLPLGAGFLIGRLSRGPIDIRVFGAIYSLLFVAGLWLALVATRRLTISARAVAVVVGAWIFLDLEYVSYFNSLYAEAAALAFGALLAGVVLTAPSPLGARHLGVILLVSALWVLSKRQTAILGPLLAGAVVYAAWSVRTPKRWRARTLVVVGAAMLCATSLAFASSRPRGGVREANLYNSVFLGALRHASPQEATDDLVELGLDPSMVRYIGVPFAARESPMIDAAFFQHFVRSTNEREVIAFYARHPGRFVALSREALRTGANMHPGIVQHFEQTSRSTDGKLRWTTSYSRAKAALGDVFEWVAPCVLSLAIVVSVWAAVRLRARRQLLLAFVAVLAAVEFFASVLGDGIYEVQKHLFMFHFLFDACVVGLCAFTAERLSRALSCVKSPFSSPRSCRVQRSRSAPTRGFE